MREERVPSLVAREEVDRREAPWRIWLKHRVPSLYEWRRGVIAVIGRLRSRCKRKRGRN